MTDSFTAQAVPLYDNIMERKVFVSKHRLIVQGIK
jgi:hypothetical protein